MNLLTLDLFPFLQAKVDFPVSVTCVAGTQAGKVTANNIVVFRMSNLHTVRPTGILSYVLTQPNLHHYERTFQ